MTTEGLTRWPVIADAFEIYEILMRLGVTANYTGFRQSAYAVYLAMQNPDRLILVSKWLYPDVAKHYGTTWLAVERNIRTAAKLAWESNPMLLCELAAYRLTGRPKAARFIAILAFYFLKAPPAA